MDDINAAIAAAVGSAKGEVTADPTAGVTPDKPAEPKPEEKPVQNTDVSTPDGQVDKLNKPVAEQKVADKMADEEEFFTPTAAELDIINKNPELQKVYRSMQRGLTKKSQGLAAEKKAQTEKLQFAEWFQKDPVSAAKAVAATVGLSVQETKQADTEKEIVDDLTTKWTETVGKDAAALLRPLFEETAAALFEKVVAPYKQTTEGLARAASERGIAATVREFGAEMVQQDLEWDDDIQSEMAKLSNRIEPATDEDGNRVSMPEYLETLYDATMAKRNRVRTAKGNLERLKRIRNEAEPVVPAKTPPTQRQSVTADMSVNDAIALAVQLSQRELGGR